MTNGFVGLLHDSGEPLREVRAGIANLKRGTGVDERINHQSARNVSTRMASHAVGDCPEPGSIVDEQGVLIGRTGSSAVGLAVCCPFDHRCPLDGPSITSALQIANGSFIKCGMITGRRRKRRT
jgi:hypothetical protein